MMKINRLLLIASCLAFVLLVNAQPATAQSYEIGQRTIQPTDTSRNGRTIATEVFYPAQTAGSNVPVAGFSNGFPLLVFGHGFSMNYNPYGNLRKELVKRGYIMVFPKTEVGPVPFPDHGAFGEDMAFLARLFLRKDSMANSDFYQRLNGKVVAMGHSMGGGCSFLAVNNEPAFTALATLAPAETNVSAIGAATSVKVPSLIMAGSEDCVTPIPDHQQPMYDTLASNCKTLAVIDQGTHCFFANSNTACDLGSTSCQPNSDISRNQQHQRMFAVLTPWLNFHLKNHCTDYEAAQQALADTSLYRVQRKCNDQLPDVNAVPGDTAILCANDTITITTSSPFANYQWNTGDTTRELTVSDTGEYSVAVSDSLGCADTSSSIHITNSPTILRTLCSDGQATFCAGDSVELSLLGSYQSYHWSNGDTSESLTTDQPGQYWVMATNQNGCQGVSDTIQVKEITPVKPVIQQEKDLLTTGSFSSYQWYRDRLPIQGADQSTLAVQDSGTYYVQVTDSNGCSSTSDTVMYEPETVGMSDPVQQQMTVAPVPAHHKLHIRAKTAFTGNTKVELISLQGRQIVRSAKGASGDCHVAFDVQKLPTGIYLLRITTADLHQLLRKVVIK
ncbi:MAG: hypothetical protein BRD50_03180 [Bacteroidetes bacterium SW_11_45_7]|nr:MAG: hypothetical protein BRD50_03180 [Bacteroidetes bacterium SW_11_45_7]